MKRTFRPLAALAVALLLLSWAGARAQETSVASIPASGAYRTGERLSYNVSFSRFTDAAHVVLFVAGRQNIGGRETIELRAHVETTGVVSAALYSLNNDYTSFVDPSTGLPVRTRQVVREGNVSSADSERDFNQPIGAGAVPNRETSGGLPGTYDFVSAVYRLRSLPLFPNTAYSFSAQGPSALYESELRVEGRELLKTNIGSFNSIVTRVKVRNDDDADDYKVRVYFSEDERHIPLLITAKHKSGEIRAEIVSADFVTEATSDTPPAAVVTPTPLPTPLPTPTPPSADRARTLPPSGVTPPTTRPGTPPAGTTSLNTAPVASGDATEGEGALPGLPFRVGEQLNFRFFMGNSAQPVGTAALAVRARGRFFNREGLLLTASMATTGPGQALFPVSDQISSFVDATSLLPFRSELRMQEGKHRFNAQINVDQDRGSAVFADGTRLDIPVGTHDLVSVFYALRSFDLTPPKRNAVSLLINKRPRTLFITALSRETIAVGGQNIPATQLALATDEGDRLQLRLWVSNDRRRLPLRIAAVTPLGPV
ncbi:MAG TPA: DUF3108 domain-containing protein, partial [Pyrinomonadaceae bacterium]|nr:DUF3108 domain-containing protein [Pyrinomonadaceae bacterium]